MQNLQDIEIVTLQVRTKVSLIVCIINFQNKSKIKLMNNLEHENQPLPTCNC